MNDPLFRHVRLLVWAVMLLALLTPTSVDAQELVPFRVMITRLEQITSIDPDASYGDFYANVTVSGSRDSNEPACSHTGGISAIVLPAILFEDFWASSFCPQSDVANPNPKKTAPWIFDFQVLDDNTAIPVRIEILDDDTLSSDDTADITEGPGSVLELQVDPSGFWTGDVNWPVSCTRGTDASICFQVGFDRDGDGLLDAWENGGIDTDRDGVVDLSLPGANPLRKDFYVEIDWEAAIPPVLEEIAEVTEAFAAAPVVNPDGSQGITLHVDTGSLRDANGLLVGDAAFDGPLGRGSLIPDGDWTFGSDFYTAKQQFFGPERAFAFRYVIYNVGAGVGQGEKPGNDIWLGSTASEDLMHELGHNLNLGHGGPPGEARNCEPNYLSIMNYRYKRLQRIDGSTHIDYSPALLRNGLRATAPLADLEEAHLDETFAIDPSDQDHWALFVGPPAICTAICQGGGRNGDRCSTTNPCPGGTCLGLAQLAAQCNADDQCGGGRCGGRDNGMSPIGQPIDWNGAVPGEVDVRQNIDGTFVPGICGNEDFAAEITELPDSKLTGYDDWSNITLGIAEAGESADAAIGSIPVEPEPGEWEDYARALNTTDLAIEKTGPDGPLEAATVVNLSYELAVSNVGPQPAASGVRDELPVGFRPVSMDERCEEAEEGVVGCMIEAFLVGEETALQIELEGVPGCRNGRGVAVVNRAQVENLSEYAGDDLEPLDNESSHTIPVVDTTAPGVDCNAPSTISPDDAPLSFTAEAVDACDPGASAAITGFDCSVVNSSGRRVDKEQSCVVEFANDTITIVDSGGVGNHITWTVIAQDVSGNSAEWTCGLEVVRRPRN